MYPINKDAKHEALAGALAEVLADAVVLSKVTQGFHWNVKGSDFSEYHEFFGGIYEDLEASVDPLAENILKLGFDAPYLLEDFLGLTSIKAVRVSSADPQTLLMDLAGHLYTMVGCNMNAFNIANDCNEQGIANFLAERDDMLKKHMWQVAASLGMSVVELKQVLSAGPEIVVDEYSA
jgi:starvation-inducible DNA-binding protein